MSGAIEKAQLTLGSLVWLLSAFGGAAFLVWGAAVAFSTLQQHDREIVSLRQEYAQVQIISRQLFERATGESLSRHAAQQGQIDALGVQMAGIDRNAAVAAEKLASIANSIADIYRLLQERGAPQRRSAIATEGDASRRLAIRDSGHVTHSHGVLMVQQGIR